jgi:hypothetical protein
MTRTWIMLFLTSLFLASTSFAAPSARNDFSFCADIYGATAAGSLYQVPLTEGIITASRSDLGDIRVFDGAGKEVPYVVIANVPPHDAVETYPLEITGYDRQAASAVVVMRLPEKHRPISVIDLDIADRDFKKRVRLSAGNDGKDWSQIAENTIVDFSSQVDVRRTRIEFPATDARYFRLLIEDIGEPSEGQTNIRLKYEGLDFSVNGVQKKELRIRSVRGSTGTPQERRPVYDQRIVRSVVATTDKDGNSVIVLPGGLPMSRLSFDVGNPYYSRTVQVYGSDTGKEDSFRLLASELIYRFPLSSEQHEERNVIEPGVPKQAFYKIVVLNRNNPPLEISGLTLSWVQQNLYFIAFRQGERYSLCYGNAKAGRPDYDIVNFVNRDTLSHHTFTRLQLGHAQAGSGAPMTLRDRLAGMEKLVLRSIVLLLVIGMGIWLYALMKRTGKGTGE